MAVTATSGAPDISRSPGAVAGENLDRLGSEASVARLCATAPVPASSGRTSRHRPNFAGHRAASRALYMIVIVRLRCERTRSYMERRLGDGKTKKEVIRRLKCFVTREFYRTLRADLATLTTRTSIYMSVPVRLAWRSSGCDWQARGPSTDL